MDKGIEYSNEAKQILYKNNRIVKAKYNLTLQQNKIYQYILFKMQYDNANESGVYRAHITTKEFKSIIKNKNEWKNDSIKELLTSLRKSTIYIEELDKNKKIKKWVDYSPITGSYYDADTDTFTIEASKTIYMLLKEYLQDGYTPVNVTIFLSLGNSYAQRLYELLRLWSNKKTIINYDIDLLKELLMLEERYKRYPDFKRRVIIPAVEELNKKANLNIEIKEQKKGRKVISLDFIVKDLDDRVYFKKEVAENMEDFYIPEEFRISKACINRFVNKFRCCNFRNELLRDMLFDAEARTLEKDNSKQINCRNFNLFYTILSNKLKENVEIAITKEESSSRVNPESFNNFEPRQYDYDSLEKKLLGWDND